MSEPNKSDYREFLRLKISVATDDGKTWRAMTPQYDAIGFGRTERAAVSDLFAALSAIEESRAK